MRSAPSSFNAASMRAVPVSVRRVRDPEVTSSYI